MAMFAPIGENNDNSRVSDVAKESKSLLLKDWASKSDINRAGLRRGKKESLAPGKGVYTMEDMHVVKIPFSTLNTENNNQNGSNDHNIVSDAFVGVFDGHVGEKCAEAVVEIFPKSTCRRIERNRGEEGN